MDCIISCSLFFLHQANTPSVHELIQGKTMIQKALQLEICMLVLLQFITFHFCVDFDEQKEELKRY